MQPYCISIDWLSLYCLSDVRDYTEYKPLFTDVPYKFKLQEYSTRQFKKVYEVYSVEPNVLNPIKHNHNSQTSLIKHNDNSTFPSFSYHYATIVTTPVSRILDKRACLIKLSNRELYQPSFADRLTQFLFLFSFVYRSISRVDIAYDCNAFIGGLRPRKLISSFLSGRYLKNGQPRYTLLADSQADKRDSLIDALCDSVKDGMNADERKAAISDVVKRKIKRSDSSVVQIQGNARARRDISYVRFGSRASAVCSYIYNKSKELKEVKNKPYIVQLWQLNNIDVEQEVWRVELSIKSDRNTLLYAETGEVFRLSPDDLKLQRDIEFIFYTYAAKYFSFKVNDLTKNKTRMRGVELFERGETTARPVTLTLTKDSTRSDRIFLKKLAGLHLELSVSDTLLSSQAGVLMEYAAQKDLLSYLQAIAPILEHRNN